MIQNILDRFLRYVKINTQSNEDTGTTPSTPAQREFSLRLMQELQEIGIKQVEVDENGYLYAELPANIPEKCPAIGFIAHVDTSPDLTAENVQPRIVKEYDGKDILLDAEEGIVLSPEEFPELLRHKGEDLVVTNGHTLLGADDKAGVAEIMSAVEYLVQHPEMQHGKVCIAFTPDEEIGLGASRFDVPRFGADWAYTVDGGEVGELEYENFNAAAACIRFSGRNVHPGSAKDKMINSQSIAFDFAAQLPPNDKPETTEGYEGFFHLIGTEGSVEQTTLRYIIRDHDRHFFEQRKKLLQEMADTYNRKYGKELVEVEITDQYYNMKEKILPNMHIVDIAAEAMRQVGIRPQISPIRGGTDGSNLSFMGLPCPNLFAGGLNFHGRYEYIPLQSMEKATRTILKIIELTAQKH